VDRVARWTRRRLGKAARLLMAAGPAEAYADLVGQWPEGGLLAGDPPPLPPPPWHDGLDAADGAMYCDQVRYLPDDLLVKVDRAAMSVALETRAPFLDHRVVEFAWRLPSALRFRRGCAKAVPRAALARRLPRALVDRPKMGFGVPIGQWLRGPLRPWADDILEEGRLRRQGWFDAGFVAARWAEHRSGRRDWAPGLWNVLAFQAWHDGR
jgi:asparagine synthase (glutamine-hydrolysing)